MGGKRRRPWASRAFYSIRSNDQRRCPRAMFATWHIGFLAMGFLTLEMNVQYRRNPASGSEPRFLA